MTDFNYEKSRTIVENLLSKFGGEQNVNAVLKQEMLSEFNPITDTFDSSIINNYDLNCVKLGYKATDFDGTLIIKGDIRLLASPFIKGGIDLLPAINKNSDSILIDDDLWSIVTFQEIKPSSLLVLLSFQLRRAN